jgi:NADPH:quinone reductase-like Zn-dependent oxidoreductase
VQFARVAGAYVIGTASADETERLRRLGASEVIDYKAQRFEQVVSDIDLVFDLVGGETQQRSFAVLKRGGALISTVETPDPAKAAQAGVTAMRYGAVANAEQLSKIAQLIDSKQVEVTIAKVFALGAASEAHRCLEDGHPHGKVVLRVN